MKVIFSKENALAATFVFVVLCIAELILASTALQFSGRYASLYTEQARFWAQFAGLNIVIALSIAALVWINLHPKTYFKNESTYTTIGKIKASILLIVVVVLTLTWYMYAANALTESVLRNFGTNEIAQVESYRFIQFDAQVNHYQHDVDDIYVANALLVDLNCAGRTTTLWITKDDPSFAEFLDKAEKKTTISVNYLSWAPSIIAPKR